MFTRSLHDILAWAAQLVGEGVLHTTLTSRVEGINAANLRRVHADVESGSSIGKTVLVGF
jgi:hypothetical protein